LCYRVSRVYILKDISDKGIKQEDVEDALDEETEQSKEVKDTSTQGTVLQKGAESEIDNSVQINNFFQKIKES
jgi:hypothetical protein